MKNSVLLAVIACVLAATGATAQVYKWVDENGKVQYGDRPPDKVKAAPVGIMPGPADSPVAKPDDWKQKDLDSQRRKIERERQEQGPRAQQAEANRAAQCSDSRRRLGVLQEQLPVYQRNDKGERVYIEDKDRARIMDELRGSIAENCK
jgi:hypothetical protein